jgi:MFS family permease
MAAKHLVIANEIGLFAALADGPAPLDRLAELRGIARPRVRILVDALVTLGLIERHGDQYRNGPVAAAFAFGSLGAFSFTGRIVFSSLSDRIGRVPTLCVTCVINILGTFLLTSLHHPTQTVLLWCHIVIYGLGFGARAPLTAALTIDLFHGEHYGAILGLLAAASGVGGTTGPWFSGFLFDRTGSYALSFGLSMGMLAVSSACAWLAGRWGRVRASRHR